MIEFKENHIYLFNPKCWGASSFHFKYIKEKNEDCYFYYKELNKDKGFNPVHTNYPLYKLKEWYEEGAISPVMTIPDDLFEL